MPHSDHSTIIYRKLVRDRIPEIIREAGNTPHVRQLDDQEMAAEIGRKIREEVAEFLQAWKGQNPDEILKEGADILEILLAALQRYDLSVQDLLQKTDERRKARGAFNERLFLMTVGEDLPELQCWVDGPELMVFPEESDRFFHLLKSEMNKSKAIYAASAFYSPGALNLIGWELSQFLSRGHEARMLLSTMGNNTPPEHLVYFSEHVPGLDVRVFHPPNVPFDQSPPDFHLKVWLFSHKDGTGGILIGSSNLTVSGISGNIEWNYFSDQEANQCVSDRSPFQKGIFWFEHYWHEKAASITQEFLEGYRQRYGRRASETSPLPLPTARAGQASEPVAPFETAIVSLKPNVAQKQALSKLMETVGAGIRKAAVIAATGVGKTHLAAFFYRQCGFRSILFLAHREQILQKARTIFSQVTGISGFGQLLGGGNHPEAIEGSIFAMIQTLSREERFRSFDPKQFDLVVVDEFHHGEAPSYKRILAYFQPRFLLGLTATPERMDGRDVLALCEYNVAFEMRLFDAIDKNLLVPFQYFAIYDPTDYEKIPWRGTHYDEEELSRALENDSRTAILANNLKRLLPSNGKIKAIAFCSSISHARYTAGRLSWDHGLLSLPLTGENTEQERNDMIRCLQNEADPLKVICVVDIFNEGVDIPELTHVLLLRPTQSFTVFLQQIGRGLRKSSGKEFLVVIDFVGNYRKVHVAPIALNGCTSVDGFLNERQGGKAYSVQLPKGCFLSADTQVQRVWDREIRRLIQGGIPRTQQLQELYLEIKEDLGIASPGLVDFLNNPHEFDPHRFIQYFGSWLETQLACDPDLPEYEKSLIGTAGAEFLGHIEKDLHPSKSYKMVVLLILLDLPGAAWSVQQIAELFKQYYLDHPEYRKDYEELDRSENPIHFPIRKVITKLKTMPLHFLSNTTNDFFVLDKPSNRFSVKPLIQKEWENERFRELIRDRTTYSLKRYFRNKTPNHRTSESF